jgi:hypothetical protein
MTVSPARIKLHFNVHEPIELTDLTLSFAALASQYRKHLVERIRSSGGRTRDLEVKLYITKIDNNCILAELAGATDILGTLFSVMDYANIFVDFVKNIDDGIQYFLALPAKDLKEIVPAKIPYSKKECSDFENFLKVVSEQGELGLSVAEYNKETSEEKTFVSFKYSSDQAFEARKGAILAQDVLESKGDADYKSVLMYYQQTNTDESKSDGKTGERAVIKAIHPKPLPVYIVSNLDREKVMGHKDDPSLNPLKVSYLVDVNVETDRNDIPKHYRVTSIIETILDDES